MIDFTLQDALIAFGWLDEVAALPSTTIATDFVSSWMSCIAAAPLSTSFTMPVSNIIRACLPIEVCLTGTSLSANGEVGTFGLEQDISKTLAGRRIAVECTIAIVGELVSPICGARVLARLAWEWDELSPELGIFVGRVDEWNYLTGERNEIEKTIIDESVEYLLTVLS